MAHLKVSSMPRKQQKAVFAKLGDPDSKYLARLEGAEKFQRTRAFLLKKQELSEDTEDKIFRIMDSKKLTHRQKMAEIDKIKKKAAKQLAGHKSTEQSPTITGEIIAHRQKLLEKNTAVQIIDVPDNVTKNRFNILIQERKLSKTTLLKHEGLLLKQSEYIEGLKAKDSMPKNTMIIRQPDSPIHRRNFDAAMLRQQIGKNAFVKVNGIIIPSKTYKKALERGERVRGKRKDSPKEQRLRKKFPNKDFDKDGVKNKDDCEPLNPKKQHVVVSSPLAVAFEERGIHAIEERGRLKPRTKAEKKKDLERRYKGTLLSKEADRFSENLKKKHPNKDFDKDGVKNAKDCEPMNPKKQDKILKSHIKFDKFSQKYKIRPAGKGYNWSENIVVNPKAPKEQWVTKGEWVKKPTFLQKHLPSVLSIRLRSAEGKKRDKLEKLVNEKGLEEGYKEFKLKN